MKSEKKNVVLDTNIIISAAICKEGLPAKILELLGKGKIINYTTEEIIEELVRVFDKPSVRIFVNDEDKALVLDCYISKSLIIKPQFNEKAVSDDIKNNTILINTARGGIVNETALYEWLAENPLSSCAVDVFEQEPYAGKLIELPNIILTPHLGSCSTTSRLDMEYGALEEVINYVSGIPLKCEVLK